MDSSGLTNYTKLELELGVLRMGCMERTEWNYGDLPLSGLNPPRNQRYKVCAEIQWNAEYRSRRRS